MIKKLVLVFAALLTLQKAKATGEPSTYFQIYVPPNNDAVRRDAALIITAIYDSTKFDIIDDGADGDTDDSKSGILMAGQSYVLYIRDNGINDDARYASGGALKWDGDYFIVKSNKLVYASQSTNSDWQHDWVPSTDKKSIGHKFIIYSPPFTSSKRDVNVFAYENNTTVTFQKISWQPKTNSGFTDVNIENPTTVFTRNLNIGEDIIYRYTNGRDVMDAGETYMIIADKPITVQYGALFGNERDGGGYVPTANGSSSGELMYFAVPYQQLGEQEIRIISWDDANTVKLERYSNGNWITVKDFTLNKMKAGDWVGRSNGNVSYATVFRVSCTSGKRVSVFEGNWFETGSPGTSDMATMISSENGTSAGTKFLTYMAPPGSQNNVINPFTGRAFGQQLTHLYIFAKEGAFVTVKDANTNGTRINKTYTIGAERYADCFLTLTEWQSIQPTGPYLIVESSSPVSVMNSNFNDNWMCYVGSPLTQNFTQTGSVSQASAIPTDTVKVTTYINTSNTVNNPNLQVIVQDGLKVVDSKLISPTNTTNQGIITEQPTKTVIDYTNVSPLVSNSQYKVETTVTASLGNNVGTPLTNSTNCTVETIVTGTINGQVQQSSNTEVINVNPNNTSKLIFSRFNDNLINRDSTDSWTVSWVDVNNDGFDDIFTTDRRGNRANKLYINNKTGGFINYPHNVFTQDSAISISNTWADVDNDGNIDLLVVNNTRKPNTFYKNVNGILRKDNTPPFVQSVSYYHGAAFADYDNDGRVDLFMSNFFPTKYNELYRSNTSNNFIRDASTVVSVEANQSIGATWADYDGDGLLDLFVPNGKDKTNSLFHNEGNGIFTKSTSIVSKEGGQSVGSCWGDYDNDGDLDLLVTNSNSQGNFLYRNLGNGNFAKVTNTIISTDRGPSHGCSFADIDNDGDLDIFITNDKGRKFLYLNNGAGNFTAKTDELINFNFGNAFGHVWSDYDNDGDLDLLVATHSNQPNYLFTNNGNSNKWIKVKLIGTNSNKSAIGVRIYIKSNGKWQLREVNAQSGFGGQNSLVQHFGIGSAAVIDSMKIKWSNGNFQYLSNIPCNQMLIITESNSHKIVGAAFNDLNGNCVKDAGEELIGRAIVNIVGKESIKAYSNNNGYFTSQLTAGNYQLSIDNSRGIFTNCTSINININNTITTDTVWLPANVSCASADIELIMGSTAIRKDFSNNQFTWVVNNNGLKKASNIHARIKMIARITPTAPSTPFSSIETITENGITKRIYTWKISQLDAFNTATLTFNHSNSGLVINDTVNITSWVELQEEDCNVSNNFLSQTYRVVGAIDPNDLQVAPVGYGNNGYIHPNQKLTYTIRFQNVGNHPATSVVIKDTLPLGLDMSTLQIVSLSHADMNISTIENQLIFSLNDTYLPDSSSNAEASQGFIIFSISPRKNIYPGTILANRASIEFDGYAVIQTNQVINTIQSKQQEEDLIEIKTFPNPASDVLNFSLQHKFGKYTQKEIAVVELTDFYGRSILKKMITNNTELRIDLPRLTSTGYYLLRITDTEGKMYSKRILIQKSSL